MTTNPGPRSPETGFYKWIRSLETVRSEDRWFGGVVSGIADRLDIDRTLARAVFVVACFLTTGVAVLFYGLCWLLLPEPDGRIHLREAGRGRWTSGMTGAAILTALGGSDVLFAVSDRGGWRGPSSVIGVVLVGLFIWMVLARRDQPRQLPRGGSAAPPPDEGATTASARPGSVHLAPSRTDWYSTGTAASPSGSGSTAADSPATGDVDAPDGAATGAGPVPDPYDSLAPPARAPQRRPAPLSLPGSLQAAVAGLALLAGAAVGLLKYLGVFTAGWQAIWTAAGATALGVMALGVMVGALWGRTSGGLTVATAILTLPVIAATTGSLIRFDPNVTQLQGTARSGYELAFGNATIDLTDLPAEGLTGGAEQTVPVDLDFADAEILVPAGVDVVLSTDQGFSSVTHPVPGAVRPAENRDRDLVREPVVDSPSDATLHLDADLSFSTLTVRVEDTPRSGATPTTAPTPRVPAGTEQNG